MAQQHHQNHATWECKYHVVFIPKYCKKAIFGVIKKRLGDVFHELARRRESKIEEGHLMPDHVHMLISILPACLPTRSATLMTVRPARGAAFNSFSIQGS